MVRRVRSASIVLCIALLSSAVSGQQPKRPREPYVAPVLPAEPAWTITLPAPPAAAAVMDETRIYVPLEAVGGSESTTDAPQARLVALDRQTGETRWTYPVASLLPPVLRNGALLVATPNEIHAIDVRDGQRQWSAPLERPLRSPLIARGALLLGLTEGNELVAFDIERRGVAWRCPLPEKGAALMTADDEAAYIAAETGVMLRVNLSDGTIRWQRPLEVVLSDPVVDRDRVFVGSNANRGTLWSLDARTGRLKWVIPGRFLAGPIVGTAVADDRLFVVSKDLNVRALKRDTGNQIWKKSVGTRPLFPPQLIDGAVAVTGLAPTLSTFLARDGAPVSTWSAPENSVLQGAPLLDAPAPFRVSMVVVLRDGQVTGLRSTAMLFKESDPGALTALPGRPLPREP